MSNMFSYNKLTCQIIISNDPGMEGGGEYKDVKYVLTEVYEIKINSSYENLIDTAQITLPRATILEAATSKRAGIQTKELLGGDDSIFKKGQRVTIYLGYDDDGFNRNNKRMFDGYISSIESDNPYTIYCKNIAYKLQTNAVKPFSSGKKGNKINDIIDRILVDTGIQIHPLSKRMDITIGNIILEKSKSGAEILESWKKRFNLVSFIKYYQGVPYLAISRTFFSVNSSETLISGEQDNIPVINFEDNVPEGGDDLKFLKLDSNTLALQAISLYPDNSRLVLYIIRDKSDPSKFQVVNEQRFSKKQIKEKFGNNKSDIMQNIYNTLNSDDKFDMSQYNVRTYTEYNLDRDNLIKNAKSAFNQISQTGIEGTVTIFGDFGIQAASMVRLLSERNPEKNGVFIVSEVETTFGTGGYRQKLKIPYKRSNK